MSLLNLFGGGRRGLSPITLGVLGLLAYKAIKSRVPAGQTVPGQAGAAPVGSGLGGGIDSILGNLGFGNRGAAGATGLSGLGGMLSGGLGDLVKQFQGAGKGEVADSWIGTGPNKTIPATDLSQVLTADQIQFLTEKTGLSREELLEGLSRELPDTVDKLTPQGRLPSPQELER